MEHTNELGIANSSARVLPAGTVCLSRTASVGYVVMLDQPMATSQDFVAWICSEHIQPEFLMYLLIAEGESILRFAAGAVHNTIYFPEVKAFHVCIPNPSEQERIVGMLDDAFEGIAIAAANAEKNLKSARSVFESRLNAIFGRQTAGRHETRLGEACAITSTLVDPRLDQYKNLIHVGAANIESQTGRLLEMRTASDEGLISGKFLFDDSMVLYSKIRPYLMKVARPDFEGLCSADMYPLAPTVSQITRDYLYYLLLSKPFTEYAIRGSARAGMPKVNREHLFEFLTWLPPLAEQVTLAEDLDALCEQVRTLESIYQRKLDALDALKKSLLDQVFSGNL
jgi:type I restriction enzyme S subunit